MKILITGSSGYLGSKVVQKLAKDKKNKIFGIDIHDPCNKEDYEFFIKGSVTDNKIISNLFEIAKPDIAIHLAFVVNSLHKKGIEDEVALNGAKFFLHGCEKHKVSKVVFMSSAAAYGAHKNSILPYTENSPVKGNEAYAYSRLKEATDKMASKFSYEHPDCKFIILRPCLFVGPNTDNTFFEVLKLPVFPLIKDQDGKHDPLFQFIHEDDMAECVIKAVEKNVKGIFNIAADGEIKLSELAILANKKRLFLPYWLVYIFTVFLWKFRILGSPPGQLDFIRYAWNMDNQKMKKELFTPQNTTLEALKAFLFK